MAISVEQAIQCMLERTPVLSSEQVTLERALGRSLARRWMGMQYGRRILWELHRIHRSFCR